MQTVSEWAKPKIEDVVDVAAQRRAIARKCLKIVVYAIASFFLVNLFFLFLREQYAL